jgi:hypothetical protein
MSVGRASFGGQPGPAVSPIIALNDTTEKAPPVGQVPKVSLGQPGSAGQWEG